MNERIEKLLCEAKELSSKRTLTVTQSQYEHMTFALDIVSELALTLQDCQEGREVEASHLALCERLYERFKRGEYCQACACER